MIKDSLSPKEINMVNMCIESQDSFNKLLHPKWQMQDYNFLLGAKMELAELVEHIGWKWWKAQNPDMEQAWIELVDIFHFIISDSIRAAMVGDIDIYMHVKDNIERFLWVGKASPISVFEKMDVMNWMDFIQMMKWFDRDMEDLCTSYNGKVILNTFRQAHGYKDGTYIKIWNGQEDNIHLEGIMNDIDWDDDSLDHKQVIYTKLETIYNNLEK